MILLPRLSEVSLQRRIYEMVLIAMIIAAVILLVRYVILINEDIGLVLVHIISVVLFIGFYIVSRRQTDISILTTTNSAINFGLVTYASLAIGGLGPGNLLLFVFFFGVMLATVPKRLVWIPSVVGWGCMLLIAILEYNNPEMRVAFSSGWDILINNLLNFVIAASLFYLLWIVIGNYNRERKANMERNKILDAQNKRLEAMDEFKSRLFAVLSHDLRSPAVDLVTFLGLAEENMVTQEDFKKAIPDMKRKLIQTNRLINNLLDWSQVSMQNSEIKKSLTMMKPLVDGEMEKMRASYSDKDVKIVNNIADEAQVNGDPNLLEAIIRNLLSNAVKFSHDGGVVRVEHHLKDANDLISIIDEGVGMDSDRLAYIFTLESNSSMGTKGEKGFGVGLLLCKDLIRRHGGRIWAESEPQKGSKFHFTIPREEV